MIRTSSEAIGEVLGIEYLPSDSITVPDMSLSVKDILMRFRRGTVDIESLERHYLDGTDDIDDDSLDGIEDMVDVFNRKEQLHGKVCEILQSCPGTPGGDIPGPADAPAEDSQSGVSE